MTYKCLKAVAFCVCWGFRKASPSQKMQTVLFLGQKAWKLGKRIKSCANNYRMLWVVKKAFVLACLTTVHEFYGLKAGQMSKVRASSHKYQDVEKIKNLCEQNFKDH